MTAPAVEFTGISYRYPGAPSAALDNVSLNVLKGERLGILGPNGGGKSTLLKLMLGLLPLQSGSLRVAGLSPEAARTQGIIGYVPQRVDAELGLPMSVREVVTLGAAWRVSPFKSVPPELRSRVDHALKLTGADSFATRPIGKLSGGQMQRAMIARALAADARILALDEPMVGIDPAGQRQFAELLDRVHRELNLTIIIVSHDLRAIVAGSDRVACLARRLHSHTSPQGLTPPVLAELFSHDVAGIGGNLQGMHVHAHAAGEPCDHHPLVPHGQAPIAPSTAVGLTVSAKDAKGPTPNG